MFVVGIWSKMELDLLFKLEAVVQDFKHCCVSQNVKFVNIFVPVCSCGTRPVVPSLFLR